MLIYPPYSDGNKPKHFSPYKSDYLLVTYVFWGKIAQILQKVVTFRSFVFFFLLKPFSPIWMKNLFKKKKAKTSSPSGIVWAQSGDIAELRGELPPLCIDKMDIQLGRDLGSE